MTSPQDSKRCKGCGEPWTRRSDYCLTCRTKEVYDSYTRAQLSEAFDSVKDPTNWKCPIDSTFPESLPQETVRLLDAAIVFYAGSKPTFQYLNGKTRVTARGYYQSVGA